VLVEHRVPLEFLEERVRLEILVKKDLLDLLGSLENLDCREPKVVMVDLVPPGQKDLKVIKGTLDHLGLQDHQGMMENMENAAH